MSVPHTGYKCLITASGVLQAGIHDRVCDGRWSCTVGLKRAIKVNRLQDPVLQSNEKCLIWKLIRNFCRRRSHHT